MKREHSKLLAVALIVGLLAVVPSSAQIEQSSRGEGPDLGMLVLINQMALSVEQMEAMHDILTGWLTSAEEGRSVSEAFRQTMIEFTGTSEELEALLVAHRREQRELMLELRSTWSSGLQEIGDLLTVNQGLVLARALRGQMAGLAGAAMDEHRSAQCASDARRPAQAFLNMRGRAFGEETSVRARIRDRLEELSERLRVEREAAGNAGRVGDEESDDHTPRRFAALLDPSRTGFRAQPDRGSREGSLPSWIQSFVLALETKLAAISDSP